MRELNRIESDGGASRQPRKKSYVLDVPYLEAAAAAKDSRAATGEAAGKVAEEEETETAVEEAAEREEEAETVAEEGCAASTSHHTSQCGREQQRNRGYSDLFVANRKMRVWHRKWSDSHQTNRSSTGCSYLGGGGGGTPKQ